MGKKKLHLYGGLNHFAQWAGDHPAGPAPSRFKDYIRVVAGAKGNGADPVFQQGPVDIANAVGNHMIVPDFGIAFKSAQATWKLYTQNIFEKGKGRGAYERDRLVGLKILGRDRLAGVSWERTGRQFLQKLVLEGLYTKYQGGPVIFEGRDNYYNNAVYNTGWEYKRRIIGTPLFINQARASYLSLEQTNLGNWNVISNRIAGLHLGLKGQITKQIRYRTLATYQQHFGNYYNNLTFRAGKSQTHLLQELTYHAGSKVTTTFALGYDAGELSNNVGALLQIDWVLK